MGSVKQENHCGTSKRGGNTGQVFPIIDKELGKHK